MKKLVLGVAPAVRYNGQQHGYNVKLSWKNGTVRNIDALNTGVGTINLVLADGTVLSAENYEDLLYKKLPQAAGDVARVEWRVS